jgi:hypothetical protein
MKQIQKPRRARNMCSLSAGLHELLFKLTVKDAGANTRVAKPCGISLAVMLTGY